MFGGHAVERRERIAGCSQQRFQPREEHEANGTGIGGVERRQVAGQVDGLLRPRNLGRQIHTLETAGLRIPDKPLHCLPGGSDRHGRIEHRLHEQVVWGGEAIDREHVVESACEQGDRGAGSRWHGVVGHGLSRQHPAVSQLPEYAFRTIACRRRHIGHECRGQQMLYDVGGIVFRDTGSERLDDAGPVLHVVGAQPCQQRLPGVGAEGVDEFAGELAGPFLRRVFALQQVNEYRQGIDASSRQLVEGSGPRGGRITGEIVGSPLESGGIPAAFPRRFTNRLHDRPHVFVTVADYPLEPADAGGIGGVAQIGQQIEPFVARLFEQVDERGEIAGGDVVGLDVGGTDRGVEQGRRGGPWRKRERVEHRLSQRIWTWALVSGAGQGSRADRR